MNILALAAANIGVVILLYVAQTPMEMVINSVALTYVFELDDALVSNRDYKATEILFREISQGKALKDVSQKLKERGFFEPQYVFRCWRVLTLVSDYFVQYALFVVMATAPFYHAICY